MRYKNTEQVRAYLKDIPNRLNGLTYRQLFDLTNTFLPSIPIPIVDFTNEQFYFRQKEFGGRNVIYRARIITNPDNTPHEYISEISHIPKDKLGKIKKFGRINKIGESMFYGSLDYSVACTEAITKGDVFKNTNSIMLTVGVWMFEEPLKFVQIPYSEKVFKKFYDTVHYKSDTIQLEDIQRYNKEGRERFNSDIEFEVLEMFADEFAKIGTKTDNDYFLTNYYADRVFDRVKGHRTEVKADGIIYNSVASSYQRKNIVLTPEVAETKLKFVDAIQVWLVNHEQNGGGAQFIPIQQRIKFEKDGKLLWR